MAVGTFDGVHLGHRQVIEGSDSVLTFDPHPVSVVAPQHTPKLLTSLARKAELIEALGVEELIVIGFDADFASKTADEFVEDVLVGALGATRVAIGENFRFGHKAQGDPRLLAADERFATVVHPLLEVDGEIVSSSHIRGLVLAGEVAEATALLGAPFQLRGEVVHGDERGRELGFPTANLIPDEALVCPGHGVYACFLMRPRPPPPGGGEHRRAPDVPDRSRRADRGIHPRLRRRSVRAGAATRLPRAPARRAPLRDRGGADRADAQRRAAHARDRSKRALGHFWIASKSPQSAF